MKKLKVILMAAAMACIFYGCDNDDNKLILVPDGAITEQTVGANDTKGTNGIIFTATSSWKSSITEDNGTKDPDWIKINPDQGEAGYYTALIELETNPNTEDRTAVIRITCGNSFTEVTVTQEGMEEEVNTKRLAEISIEDHYWGDTHNYKFEYNANNTVKQIKADNKMFGFPHVFNINFSHASDMITLTSTSAVLPYTATHTLDINNRMTDAKYDGGEYVYDYVFSYDDDGRIGSVVYSVPAPITSNIEWSGGNIVSNSTPDSKAVEQLTYGNIRNYENGFDINWLLYATAIQDLGELMGGTMFLPLLGYCEGTRSDYLVEGLHATYATVMGDDIYDRRAEYELDDDGLPVKINVYQTDSGSTSLAVEYEITYE